MTHVPKKYMYVDLKESQYNGIDENVYEKIKTELPMENTMDLLKLTRERTRLINLKKNLQ